jgi:hypothetical protein
VPTDERSEIDVADIEDGIALAPGDDAVDARRRQDRSGAYVGRAERNCDRETEIAA